MTTGTNLVIQQVGDVTRVQESMQRTAELQQATVTQGQLKQTQLEQSQVQKSDSPYTQNRVGKDGRKEKEEQKKNQGRKPKQRLTEQILDLESEGAILDFKI